MATTWAEQEHERHEREKEEWLRSRPVCDECGDPIQDEGLYRVDGFIYCEDCFGDFCKREFYERIDG